MHPAQRVVFPAVLLLAQTLLATPPYKDPNQPYDRLPGTLETEHTQWARPYAGGKLNVLFIVPYCNSREVVETAQRLDLRYTVIMCADHSAWAHGYFEGATATPLKGVEAETVLNDLARRRLGLGFRYDAIVIGKVSWVVMPDWVRTLILQHVQRGTGLVYVCPNRLKRGQRSREEVKGPDPAFVKLFETTTAPAAPGFVLDTLPLDVMPLHVVKGPADYAKLTVRAWLYYAQRAVAVTATRHGKGRVMGLDYFDEARANQGGNSLTPYISYIPDTAMGHDPTMYDLSYALLTRCVLWAAAKEPAVRVSVAVAAPATKLKAPVPADAKQHYWQYDTPAKVVARSDLGKAKLTVSLSGKAPQGRCMYRVRTRMGDTVTTGQLEPGTPAVPLPMLGRGTYIVDVRLLDHTGRVVDFAATSLRVECAQQVKTVATEKEAYRHGDTLNGTVTFARPLGKGETADVEAVDTWGRTVARVPVKLDAKRTGGTFGWRVHRPLCRLWDIHARIRDAKGVVDSARAWVGLPNWNFDNYMYMLIFAPSPGTNWKGNLYGTVARRYGINATFTQQIYGRLEQYEHNARFHLQSVAYAEHMGEHYPGAAHGSDKENTTSCLSEVSRMLRRIADTGKPLDPKEFPYKLPMGAWQFDAGHLNAAIARYKASAKFGTPFYVLTGENYLLGETTGREYSGFSALCTKLFREWCREQYKGDLKALNAEWGSTLKSWDEVRGIMLKDAVEKSQLPRWVDFRYFMRSRVWSQFFIDWTDMIRRFAPQARTGRVGHDHHDFTRYRHHMASSKLYITPGYNAEWRNGLIPELPQSFSGDRGFYMGSWSMIRWDHSHKTPTRNKRWPWKILFLGLRGFDWENCLPASLGGMSCVTPDFSEALPFFKNVSREVRLLQRGIGSLTFTAKPVRSKVAILWAPYNHYISRLHPFQPNGFSGTWFYNCSIAGGAHSDALALLNSLRIRPTFVGPQDLADGGLQKRGFRALVLPYSRGMSQLEADAIRRFVKEGGLVIADNTPATSSEHGRELDRGRLADLFPTFKRKNLVRYGKGHAAYVPGEINGYLGRFEKCNYAGSDSVGLLLKKLAGIVPPVELIDPRGIARRDTLMPVFRRGATTLVGLLRSSPSDGKAPDPTTVRLGGRYHVWDARRQAYLGHTDTLRLRLDMMPQYLALLKANPRGLALAPKTAQVRQGADMVLEGTVEFGQAKDAHADAVASAVHLRVYAPDGKELEHFRKNVVFDGRRFSHTLPISLSEPPGRYTVEAENAVTGTKAIACFDVAGEDAQ